MGNERCISVCASVCVCVALFSDAKLEGDLCLPWLTEVRENQRGYHVYLCKTHPCTYPVSHVCG